tara:strand:- start:517 stop:1212 length:696 start_codon:yes stop_codon:yes gene_type:complete
MSEYYKYENQEYYNKCIGKYDKLYNTNTSINNNLIKLHYLNEMSENQEYNFEIQNIVNFIKSCKTKHFIPGVSEIYETDQLKLNGLIKIILPYFEKIYNSYLKIIDVKILKHLSGIHSKKGAFMWHYDNHPKLVINVIIYLNDVNNNEGGFEYITINNTVVKFNFSQPAGNRNMEHFISTNYKKINFHQVLGKIGTLFYFDNNIVHRAGPNINKERTALILQLYPSLHKTY